MARHRPVEAPKPPTGVKGEPLPRHLQHRTWYAAHVGLDPVAEMYASWVQYHAARTAWFRERGCVGELGHIDYKKARALGLLRRSSDGAA